MQEFNANASAVNKATITALVSGLACFYTIGASCVIEGGSIVKGGYDALQVAKTRTKRDAAIANIVGGINSWRQFSAKPDTKHNGKRLKSSRCNAG